MISINGSGILARRPLTCRLCSASAQNSMFKPTASRTPTPTPAPKVVDSLRPLEGNLLRIWTYDDALARWDYYDPRPSFAGSNNMTALIGGTLYWVNVKEDLTVTLNGRQLALFAGWNIIHW